MGQQARGQPGLCCGFFRARDRNPRKPHCLAGAGGLEPPNGGTKTRCLTTWLRPNTDRMTGAQDIAVGADTINVFDPCTPSTLREPPSISVFPPILFTLRLTASAAGLD